MYVQFSHWLSIFLTPIWVLKNLPYFGGSFNLFLFVRRWDRISITFPYRIYFLLNRCFYDFYRYVSYIWLFWLLNLLLSAISLLVTPICVGTHLNSIYIHTYFLMNIIRFVYFWLFQLSERILECQENAKWVTKN